MSTLPEYRYQPLATETTIRVLVLHPTYDFTAPLEVSVEHGAYRSSNYYASFIVHYEAVSYCWGEANLTHSVHVKHDGSSLAITTNVDSMLRHLRKPHREKRLWVDALCINQADPDEKAVQVRKMGDIYAAATKVHVWLGADPVFDAETTFTYLRELAVLNALSVNERRLLAGRITNSSYSVLKPDLQRLFRNPWFTRRWVIQEVTLGHELTVHHGHNKIAWSWFTKGIMLLPETNLQILSQGNWRNYRPFVAAARTIGTSLHGKSDFQSLLLAHVSAECFDPRDRFFALYGITKFSNELGNQMEFEKLLPKVDYSKDWTEIYFQLAEAMVRLQPAQLWRHLWLFGSVALAESSAPSWVPDWRRSDVMNLPRPAFYRTGSEKVLSGLRRQELQLSGWLYGTITKVWDVLPTSQITLADIVTGTVTEGSSLSWDPVRDIRDRVKQRLAALLAHAGSHIDSDYHSTHGLTRHWSVMFAETPLPSLISMIHTSLETWRPLFGDTGPDRVSTLVSAVMRRNRIFRTVREVNHGSFSYGSLGITTAGVQSGDMVFRCSGPNAIAEWDTEDDLLLLLRPVTYPFHSREKEGFKFIGFCFGSQDRAPENPDFWKTFPMGEIVLV